MLWMSPRIDWRRRAARAAAVHLVLSSLPRKPETKRDRRHERRPLRPADELVPLAEKLLEVPQQLIRTALELELREGSVIADRVGETPCVFLAGLHRAERTIADRLMRLASAPLPWRPIDPDKALPWVEKHIRLTWPEAKWLRSSSR